jgi:hypothetical protein
MDVITDSALASKFPNESAKFYVPYASTTGRANPITNIKTLQNIVGKSRNIQWYMNWRNIPQTFGYHR